MGDNHFEQIQDIAKNKQAWKRKATYATKEEFQRFKQEIGKFLLSLLDFLTSHESESLFQQEERWDKGFITLAEGRPPPSKEFTEVAGLHLWLWSLAILLFGFGDSFTSMLAFSAGAYELNPLLGTLIGVLGTSIWLFITLKMIVLIGLFLLSYWKLAKYSWAVPALLCILGSYLVLSNLISFLKLS